MSVMFQSAPIADILAAPTADCHRVLLLLDRYTALPSREEREAFVLALSHQLLMERARRRVE